MTDRVRHLTVILEDDMRDEEESVDVVINAIRMIRCVAEVHKTQGHVARVLRAADRQDGASHQDPRSGRRDPQGRQVMNLKIDPARLALNETPFAAPSQETGICVRAQDARGDFRRVDIVCLDRQSLVVWLRSQGGENVWAENVVLILLGHTPAIGGPVALRNPES